MFIPHLGQWLGKGRVSPAAAVSSRGRVGNGSKGSTAQASASEVGGGAM